MNPARTPEQSISQLVDSGVTLPPMPAIGVQLMEIARQPLDEIDLGKITRLVEQDPSLVARILQLANSPYFGAIGNVTGLRHAINLIGLGETINMLNYFVLQHTVSRFPTIEGITSTDFWAHSWACASAARMFGLPHYLVRSHPGDLYLAGLLHSIGYIVLAQHRPDELRESMQLAAEKSISLHQAENERLGFDHAMVGAEMLSAWNLPESVRAAVRGHLNPERVAPAHREIAGLVQLAKLIAYEAGHGLSNYPAQLEIRNAWICQHGDSVFTDALQRSKIVDETIKQLRQQSASILESELDTETEQQDRSDNETPVECPARETAPPKKEQPSGLWGKVRSIWGR